MNISLATRRKQNVIEADERVNRNFDAIVQDLTNMKTGLEGYLIDLANDVDPATFLALARLAGVDGITQNMFLRKDGTFATISLASLAGIPLPGSRRVGWSQVDAAGLINAGCSSTATQPTINGSGGTGTGTRVQDSAGFWERWTVTNISGNFGSLENQTGTCRGDSNPYIRFYVRTGSDITHTRIWLGLFKNVGLGSNTYGTDDQTAANIHAIAFRYSTSASDPGWVGYATNAGATSAQTTAKVADIAVSTTYLLEILVTNGGGTIAFSVNGGAAQTLDTSASPITNNLRLWLSLTTLANEQKIIDWRTFYFDTN